MQLIEKLNWRYATKRMNGQSVPQHKLENILEAIRLAPTSMGLQPYQVLVIQNKDTLNKIHKEAIKQPQVAECSELIVFAAWKNLDQQHIDQYIQQIADTRGLPIESLDAFKSNLVGLLNRDSEKNFEWAARQTYIALGFGLVAAADEQVDATPMEGFNTADLDRVLGLHEKGLGSTVAFTVGYRDAVADYLNGQKKVRRSREHLFSKI